MLDGSWSDDIGSRLDCLEFVKIGLTAYCCSRFYSLILSTLVSGTAKLLQVLTRFTWIFKFMWKYTSRNLEISIPTHVRKATALKGLKD